MSIAEVERSLLDWALRSLAKVLGLRVHWQASESHSDGNSALCYINFCTDNKLLRTRPTGSSTSHWRFLASILMVLAACILEFASIENWIVSPALGGSGDKLTWVTSAWPSAQVFHSNAAELCTSAKRSIHGTMPFMVSAVQFGDVLDEAGRVGSVETTERQVAVQGNPSKAMEHLAMESQTCNAMQLENEQQLYAGCVYIHCAEAGLRIVYLTVLGSRC